MADDDFKYMNERSIDPELKCSICHDVFEDPHLTPCRHRFCRQCITNWLEEDDRCSICREHLELNDLQRDEGVADIIDQLPVICNKCGHSGIFRHQFDHHIKNCRSKIRPNSSAKTNNNIESVDKINRDINAINERLNNQQNEIQTLKQSNLIQQETIQELELHIETQTEKINEQKDLIISLKQQMTHHSNDNQTRIGNFEEEMRHNLDEIKHHFEKKINNLIPYRDNDLEEYINENCSFRSQLVLARGNLYDKHMGMIVRKGILNRQYSSLDLRKNHFTCQGISILSGVFHQNNSLKKLDLSSNDIYDQGIQYLAEALLGNTTLLDLRLASTKLTNQGIEYLVEMLQSNQTLEKLYLHENDFDDHGMKLLANVLSTDNQTLKELVIHSNRWITDRSWNSILNMMEKSELELIDIQLCDFSDHVKKRLRDAARKARIEMKI